MDRDGYIRAVEREVGNYKAAVRAYDPGRSETEDRLRRSKGRLLELLESEEVRVLGIIPEEGYREPEPTGID